MKKLLLSLGLAGTLLPLATSIANAAPPPAVYKTAEGEVVMHSGLSSGQSVTIGYPNVPAKKNIKAGFCDTVTITNSSTQPISPFIRVDGEEIDTTSLPIQAMPKCENNILTESRPVNFKLTNGNVVVVGKTAGFSYPVEFIGSTTARSAKANGCGFLTVRSTAALPIGNSITLNGVIYNLASLTTDKLPVCRSVNGSSVRYNPSTW